MEGTVLIVDDSLTVRMDLAETFEAAGFVPLLCATVAEARARLTGDPVDVVILDLLLPDGDGIELLREVRASPSASAVVIMLSTEAEVKDRVAGLQTGADDYIGKPYDAGKLISRVRALLRSGQSARTAEEPTILIIDDSPTFRNALADACRSAGYRIVQAESGEAGLRAAADTRPSAMIVDGVLPGIDGVTVIQRVRSDMALRGIPCLMLTASDDKGDELRALEAGANAFVHKDEDPIVILARLEAVLRQAEPGQHTIASLLEPKTVLAIDDSETVRRVLAEALRDESFELVLAGSGEEALKLLAVQTVDCILLDLIMPGMGGLEFCRRVKADPALRDIPVLILTDRDDSEAIIEGLGAGADDYISKAGDLRFLSARVSAQLRRKQVVDEQRRIREQMLRHELEAAEARAVRDIAEVRAALADELAEKNSELAAAKAQLEDYAHTLEDRVQERSEQLSAVEQQLRHAQKMEAIGQLTGGIAHDFNNLLGIVIGNLDLLIEDLVDAPDEMNLAQEALAGALRGATLTQRMLAFARKQPLQPSATDLNEGLAAMEPLLRRALREDIEIVMAPAPDLEMAFCDRHQIEDAILNFAINARDAMPNGGTLLIETGNVSLDEQYAATNVDVNPGDYVMLAISDTGSGMPPEVIERAFDPFFTTKGAGKGSGLGLSMVYGFAKQSGGHVKIYSELGRGTTIKLYLPRASSTEERLAPDSAAGVQGVRGTETILVVEDDPGLRQVAVKMLGELGYDMREAADPAEALTILTGEPDIRLVFTDIVMPGGMTGIMLAQQVQLLRPDIKILLTTGYSETFVRKENGDLDGIAFISKPYRKRDLAAAIRYMLDERRSS